MCVVCQSALIVESPDAPYTNTGDVDSLRKLPLAFRGLYIAFCSAVDMLLSLTSLLSLSPSPSLSLLSKSLPLCVQVVLQLCGEYQMI